MCANYPRVRDTGCETLINTSASSAVMNLVQIISLEVIYFLRAELHWNQHFRILKIGKRIELEQAKTLASGKYDSGRGTSGIKPTKPF